MQLPVVEAVRRLATVALLSTVSTNERPEVAVAAGILFGW